jgi:hypothetical protein
MVTRAPLKSRYKCTRVHCVAFLKTVIALVPTITASHVTVHTTALNLIKLYRELCTSVTDSMFKFLTNCGERSRDCCNRYSSSFMYLLYRISYSLIMNVELSNWMIRISFIQGSCQPHRISVKFFKLVQGRVITTFCSHCFEGVHQDLQELRLRSLFITRDTEHMRTLSLSIYLRYRLSVTCLPQGI